MVNEKGGLKTAQSLLKSTTHSDGLTELCLANRLDISIEALILDEKWHSLFTNEERLIAAKRLKDLGYQTASLPA
jgi:hypothetical protein